jgi:hypothetical protein
VEPCITRPEQVEALPVPDVRQGRTGEVLQNIKRLAATLRDGERIRQPDIQSPLGVAELLWDESFYTTLLEYPDAVHALLDKITGFIIAFLREDAHTAGPRLNAAGFPLVWADAEGTMVADDTMSLVSPGMHADFSVPYLNRIAEACGPLFYHSCTWREKYVANVRCIGPVRAYNWNPGNSDDAAVLIPPFSGRAVLALHLCADMHRDNDVLALGRNFADEAEYFTYVLDCMQENTTMYWWFSNVVTKGHVMERIYDALHERGYTPAAAGLEP